MRRWSSIVALLPLLVLPLVLDYQGGRLDVIQSIAFPVILLLVFFVRARKILNIPAWVPVLAVCGWMSCMLYRDVSIDWTDPQARLGVARFNKDPLGIESRTLQRYGAIVARTYGVDAPLLVNKSFPSANDAYEWLRKRSDPRLLVVGEKSAWDLVFGTATISHDCRSTAARCKRVESIAKSYDVRLSGEGIVVDPQFSPTPLVFVARPELIHVPSDPIELTAHSLVWLTAGLKLAAKHESANGHSGSENFARAEDAMFEAAAIMGEWKSIASVAAASAILGTFKLTDGEIPSPTNLVDGLTYLNRALKLSRSQYDVELYAMILNNLAVARLFKDSTMESNLVARNLLRQAANYSNSAGKPVLAARVATMNLVLLDGADEVKEPVPEQGDTLYAENINTRSS